MRMHDIAVALILAACGGSSSSHHGDGGTNDGTSGDGGLTGNCIPSCSGKTCGDDGCGGACGACAPSQLCGPSQTCAAAPGGSELVVDAASGPHGIHPQIYGLAYATPTVLADLHVPLDRWGGNGSTLYNWQLDVHNTGNDYFFENIADTGTGGMSSADSFVTQNRAAGADTLMTIPTIGWTPKDRVANHPFTCGFPVSVYGAEQQVDPYDANCGNGMAANGTSLTPDPAHDSTAAPPSFEQQWLAHLVQTFGTTQAGGIHYYQLDNEMNLWGSTHRDVHPNPVSTDEIWMTTSSYAPVIKAADPGAIVLGYTTWGVLDMFVSALDTANANTADQQAHGGIPLGRYYLQQLAAYEQQHGQRIVDCYDMHYYPQGGDPLVNTRSLWDTTYPDPSWVNSFLGEPIQLLPRVKSWVAQDYPGTGVCISEYNFNLGSEGTLAAGLVEADVLGIFGAWGVRLAGYWTTPPAGGGAYRAFQMYRNYDGAGARFGDISIGAASSLANVAIYAASDAKTSPTQLTVVIINKGASAVTATLAIHSFTPTASAQVWQVINNAAPVRKADAAITGGQVALALPASSITMVVIK